MVAFPSHSSPEGQQLLWTPFHPLGYTETSEWQHKVLWCNLEPLQYLLLSSPTNLVYRSDRSKASAAQGSQAKGQRADSPVSLFFLFIHYI